MKHLLIDPLRKLVSTIILFVFLDVIFFCGYLYYIGVVPTLYAYFNNTEGLGVLVMDLLGYDLEEYILEFYNSIQTSNVTSIAVRMVCIKSNIDDLYFSKVISYRLFEMPFRLIFLKLFTKLELFPIRMREISFLV